MMAFQGVALATTAVVGLHGIVAEGRAGLRPSAVHPPCGEPSARPDREAAQVVFRSSGLFGGYLRDVAEHAPGEEEQPCDDDEGPEIGRAHV